CWESSRASSSACAHGVGGAQRARSEPNHVERRALTKARAVRCALSAAPAQAARREPLAFRRGTLRLAGVPRQVLPRPPSARLRRARRVFLVLRRPPRPTSRRLHTA